MAKTSRSAMKIVALRNEKGSYNVEIKRAF